MVNKKSFNYMASLLLAVGFSIYQMLYWLNVDPKIGKDGFGLFISTMIGLVVGITLLWAFSLFFMAIGGNYNMIKSDLLELGLMFRFILAALYAASLTMLLTPAIGAPWFITLVTFGWGGFALSWGVTGEFFDELKRWVNLPNE